MNEFRYIRNKVLGIVLVTVFSFILNEILLSFAALYSFKLNYLTKNPYQQVYMDKITDWQTAISLSTCPSKPGLILNGFVFNSHGFESPNYPYSKPSNTIRILLLGDSFGIGSVPYNSNFIQILENQLNQELLNKKNHKVQAINLSINCIGTGFYKRLLEVEGVKYKPDVIVVSFFVGNDFTDDMDYHKEFVKSQQTLLKDDPIPIFFYRSKFMSLIKNLYLLKYSGKNLQKYSSTTNKSLFGTYIGGEQVSSYSPFRASMSDVDFINMEKRRLDVYIKNSTTYSFLNKIQENLLAIRDISNKIKGKILVLIIPDEMQINSQLITRVSEERNIPEKLLDKQLPQKILTSFLKKNNIKYVDLLESFNNQNADYFYQPRDSHLNIYGTSAVAKILYANLQEIISKL